MNDPKDDASLRARASALLAPGADAGDAEVPPEILPLVHELRVHQIELQLQNEELRRSRAEVEDGLARYTELYEDAPIGYVTLGVDGHILRVNRAAAALLGSGHGPLVGQRLGLCVQMSDRRTFNEFVTRVFERDAPASCEVVLECDVPAGPVLVELTGSASADRLQARVVAKDITESRRTSTALHDREVRYRTLFECSRDALLTLSPPDLRFGSANRAAQAMFDADEAALALCTFGERSPPTQADGCDSGDAVAAHVAIAMRDGSHSFDWTFRRGEDSFPAAVSLTRMDVDGAPVIHASIRDETDKRAALAHLSQIDRLSSMGLLAAGVAHEINNPLAYVLANLESLSADLAEPRLGDAFERATEALQGVRRICDVVRGLSAFSRVEQVERSRVDVERALSSAIAMAANQFRYRARLTTDFGVVPDVWASEGKLSQVFLNLLLNASHALEDGDIALACITVRTWADGDTVCIEVGDTGRGISPVNLPRVFEPFFTTKGVGKGSGLGLAICQNLISELGGTLVVTSTVGVGTQVVVRLPAAPVAVAPLAASAARAAPATARGHVLVIDDEPAIRNAIRRLLQPLHDVVVVESGTEAMALVEADSAFDVILCDLMMPGMTGMQFHAWLVAHDPSLAARVVFITGGAFTPNATEYLELVAAPRLDKPFDAEKMRATVANMVASR